MFRDDFYDILFAVLNIGIVLGYFFHSIKRDRINEEIPYLKVNLETPKIKYSWSDKKVLRISLIEIHDCKNQI